MTPTDTPPEPAISPDTQAVVAAIDKLTAQLAELVALLLTDARPLPEPSLPGWEIFYDDGRPSLTFPVEGDARKTARATGGRLIPPRTPVLDPRRWADTADDERAA